MKVIFSDIEWDSDDNSLPLLVTVNVDDAIDVEQNGADILSDEYGYCVHCFSFEIGE